MITISAQICGVTWASETVNWASHLRSIRRSAVGSVPARTKARKLAPVMLSKMATICKRSFQKQFISQDPKVDLAWEEQICMKSHCGSISGFDAYAIRGQMERWQAKWEFKRSLKECRQTADLQTAGLSRSFRPLSETSGLWHTEKKSDYEIKWAHRTGPVKLLDEFVPSLHNHILWKPISGTQEKKKIKIWLGKLLRLWNKKS